MKRKSYLAPVACSIAELEPENPILGDSQIDVRMTVDHLEEHYYGDGTEESSDYLIVF